MEDPEKANNLHGKKIVKQLTRKRGDSEFHSVVRAGELEVVLAIISGSGDEDLRLLLSKQNQSGETVLYVAAEYGNVCLVKEMIGYYDVGSASIKAKNGYDAFHIASKQGALEILWILMEAIPQLIMTYDQSNSTALHTAAGQGHVDVVKFLLKKSGGLAAVQRNNGKTALHSSARNGHLEVVKALLSADQGIATWSDKKGQTALHMAVKGQNVEVVNVLLASADSLGTMVDAKGNSALHIATRKGRAEIVRALLQYKGLNIEAINKSGETALDTAEKTGNLEIVIILKNHGVQSAQSIKRTLPNGPARELKQTVSDIKYEVHDQLEHTRKTRKHVKGITKRLNKIQEEGLNNAINSTTIVAVLIATVAFAAIFSLPGQYVDDPQNVPSGFSMGEAHIAAQQQFTTFLISDSLALFISLAVVVVQTSIVVVDRDAKKQMMSVINKLMWLASAFISVAFLSLSYIVVGRDEKWLAISVTVVGTLIMCTTLGVMCYWVIIHRIEASNLRSLRRSARSSKSQSWSASAMSDSEAFDGERKKLYAI